MFKRYSLDFLFKKDSGEFDLREMSRGVRLDVKGFASDPFLMIAQDSSGTYVRAPAAADLDVPFWLEMTNHGVKDGGIERGLGVRPCDRLVGAVARELFHLLSERADIFEEGECLCCVDLNSGK